MKRNILSFRQIAEKYDVSISRLHKASHRNEFPYFKQGKNFVYESDFLEWLTSNRVESTQEVKAQSAIPA